MDCFDPGIAPDVAPDIVRGKAARIVHSAVLGDGNRFREIGIEQDFECMWSHEHIVH